MRRIRLEEAGETARGGEVDLVDLPPELACRVEHHLRPCRLDTGDFTSADPVGSPARYELTVFPKSGLGRSFGLDGEAQPSEVLGVIGELMLEILSRQTPVQETAH